MTEKQSVEQLKWLMLGKKVGKDDDVNSLLLSIGEELLVEELEELEQQQCQLEEEVERESTLMEVSMMHLTVKNLQELFEMFNGTMDYMEDLNPNVEPTGITRHKVTAFMAQYEQLPSEKRRDANQAKLDTFRRPLLDEPRPSMSRDSSSSSSGTTTFHPAPPSSILTIAATASNSSSDVGNPSAI